MPVDSPVDNVRAEKRQRVKVTAPIMQRASSQINPSMQCNATEFN